MNGRTVAFALICILIPGAASLAEGLRFYAHNRSTAFIDVDGRSRGYVLHVPDEVAGTGPVPLVISLHGAGLWGAAQRDISRWNDLADSAGFIVTYPSGDGRWSPRAWASAPGSDLLRDVLFISSLIDTLVARHNVDPRRVYVNGLSNGGGFAFALSCAVPERIAAVGLVASALTHAWQGCDSAPPVPVVMVHGRRDPIVPYAGGRTWIGPLVFPGIPRWAARWAARNGCAPEPRDTSLDRGVTRRSYSECIDGADVVLYALRDDGHVWPGGGSVPRWLVGPDTGSFDATAVLWEFFSRH